MPSCWLKGIVSDMADLLQRYFKPIQVLDNRYGISNSSGFIFPERLLVVQQGQGLSMQATIDTILKKVH